MTEEAPVEERNLEASATDAAIRGDNAKHLADREQLFELQLARSALVPAARSAFWLGFRQLSLGETALGRAWLGRASKLLDEAAVDCAERGYLLLPQMKGAAHGGDFERCLQLSQQALAIGERFGDAGLCGLSRCHGGKALLELGRIEEGLALCDECLLSACKRELSPICTGLVFCSVITSCYQTFAFDRVRQWTEALS